MAPVLSDPDPSRGAAVVPRVDIHCHLLPGVDDGPRDLPESLTMAEAAVADGTTAIVATPHVRPDMFTAVSEIPRRVAELREDLRRASIALQVHAGGEVGHDMIGRLTQGELETVAQGPPGARWILLETPFAGIDAAFHVAAAELRDRGFGVVLAHPERSAGLLENGATALWRELEAGSALQVNVWSIAGGYGAEAEATAAALLDRRVVAALASDSHPGWRTPSLTTGAAAARACGVPERTARGLIDSGPARLLRRGLPVPAAV